MLWDTSCFIPCEMPCTDTLQDVALKAFSIFFLPISNLFWQNTVVLPFQIQSVFFACYLQMISLAL